MAKMVVDETGRPVASSFGEPLTLDVTEEPVRARDVRKGSEVRPAFASDYWRVLYVQPLSGPHVRVVWDLTADEPNRGPDVWTVFEGCEWLAERPVGM
jgi:hypothetical protein